MVSCVLGYYHAQLTDIVQYPDARTELFHAFRELGNIILFCMLIEQGINVRHKVRELIDFIQDDEKLREERKKAKKNKDKYIVSEFGSLHFKFEKVTTEEEVYSIKRGFKFVVGLE